MHAFSSQSSNVFICAQIETRNRFRSLRSKPVDVDGKKTEQQDSERNEVINEENLRMQSPRTQGLKEREIFHDTFSFLIKLVNTLILYIISELIKKPRN